MDTDNVIIMSLAAILMTIVVSIAATFINIDNKITEMVKAGADPVAAACALRSDGHEAMCVLKVAR